MKHALLHLKCIAIKIGQGKIFIYFFKLSSNFTVEYYGDERSFAAEMQSTCIICAAKRIIQSINGTALSGIP